jgi:hypothetical protein
MRPQGLKPALILGALRGAEAPLFHGAARIGIAHGAARICAAGIWEFFRSH